MSKRPEPQEDPVVTEVRAIRARMWKEAGGTIAGYLRLLDQEHSGRKPKRRTVAR